MKKNKFLFSTLAVLSLGTLLSACNEVKKPDSKDNSSDTATTVTSSSQDTATTLFTGTAGWGGDVFTLKSDHTGSWVWETNSVNEALTWEIKDDFLVVKNSENAESKFGGNLTYTAVLGGGRMTPTFKFSIAQLQAICGTGVDYITLSAWEGMSTFTFKTDKKIRFTFTQLPAPEEGSWAIPAKRQASDQAPENEGKLVITKSDDSKIVAEWDAAANENAGALKFKYVAVINSQLAVDFSLSEAQAVLLGYKVAE